MEWPCNLSLATPSGIRIILFDCLLYGRYHSGYAGLALIAVAGDLVLNIFRRTKTGGRLALLAMAMQLLFAFGHVDLPNHHVNGQLVLLAKSLLFSNDFGSTPQKTSHKQSNNSCPTCWTQNAAGTPILPTMVIVALLLGPFVLVSPANSSEAIDSDFLRSHKQRGPPLIS